MNRGARERLAPQPTYFHLNMEHADSIRKVPGLADKVGLATEPSRPDRYQLDLDKVSVVLKSRLEGVAPVTEEELELVFALQQQVAQLRPFEQVELYYHQEKQRLRKILLNRDDKNVTIEDIDLESQDAESIQLFLEKILPRLQKAWEAQAEKISKQPAAQAAAAELLNQKEYQELVALLLEKTGKTAAELTKMIYTQKKLPAAIQPFMAALGSKPRKSMYDERFLRYAHILGQLSKNLDRLKTEVPVVRNWVRGKKNE